MKIFSKKSNSEPLKTLNEREIQERLYGKFHAESKAQSGTATLPKPELRNQSISYTSEIKQKNIAGPKIPNLFSKISAIFPWKLAGIVVGSIVGIIFMLNVLSSWLTSFENQKKAASDAIKAESKIEPKVQKTPVVEVTKAQISQVKTEVKAKEAVKASPPIETVKPVTPAKPIETPKKRHYAVQICTYYRESDAKQLTQELTALNFPAFYQSVSSGHFLVFLSKEDSYTAAQTQLEQFRRTEQFKKFPDSFVRSV